MTEFDYNNSTKVLEECVKLIKSSNRDEMTKLFFDNSFNISLNLANKDFDQELMNDLVNKYYPDLESNDDFLRIEMVLKYIIHKYPNVRFKTISDVTPLAERSMALWISGQTDNFPIHISN